ncbi:polysaccharide pyruvyl transferase family protein [Bremerella cremea]|uniref:Polysaccharide pyruvyl transferase family protein n=1 Tax=Bremerella cremea TaxID=1031537 RepID=A0A368KP88_9BACT|nr:polysaccharide pyruvyl transferase family protein [Bremerella cremea]RCS46352.1 polysaccharide pyruvyl transferase family protein [Bremerella cremea]
MKLALFGTFDVPNYGDCEFPAVVEHFCRERINGPFEMDLYSPFGRPASISEYSSVKAIPGSSGISLGCKYDAISLVGGDTVTAGHNVSGVYCRLSPRELSAGLRCWLYPAIESLRTQVPWILHSVGIRPISEELQPGLIAAFNAAAHAKVRDPHSRNYLKSLGVEVGGVTDIGFGIPSVKSDKEWDAIFSSVRTSGGYPDSYIVVQASRGYIQGQTEEFVNAIVEIGKKTGKPLLFLPLCHHLNDRVTLTRLYAMVRAIYPNCILEKRVLTTNQTAAVLRDSEGYVGTSMHGAITALAFAKPATMLVSQIPGKHDGTLAQAGYHELCTLNPAELLERYELSGQLDLIGKAKQAAEEVGVGFDQLVKVMSDGGSSSGQVDWKKQLIESEIAERDLYPGGLRVQLKRLIFCGLRSHEAVFEAYEYTFGGRRL